VGVTPRATLSSTDPAESSLPAGARKAARVYQRLPTTRRAVPRQYLTLWRLNDDGTPDASFGDRGPAAWRFLPDGTPDLTFGEHGYVILQDLDRRLRFHGSPAMDVDSSNRIVVAGWISGNEFDVLICRLNPDGSPDRSFGIDGFVRYDRSYGFGGLE
jgi:uncharacterized delta-60 repeat protein